MMSQRWLTFINQSDYKDKPRRTRELLISQVRAHAARAAYQARQAGQQHRTTPVRTAVVNLAPASRSRDDDEKKELDAVTYRKHLESPYPLFGFYRAELYDSLPIKDCVQIMNIVDIYFQSLMPIDDLPFRIFDIPPIYTTGNFCLAGDLGMLFAIIAGFKQCIDHLRDHKQAQVSPSTLILASRGIALNMLVQRLSKPSPHLDDDILQTVALLAWQARHAGDDSGYELHWRNYSRLVSARAAAAPSSKAFDDAPVSLVVLDSTAAIESGQSMFPHARPSYITPHPSATIKPDDASNISALPRGFRILARYQLLSADTTTVLSRAAHIFESLQTSPQVLAADPTRDWRYRDYLEACPCLGSKEMSLDKMVCLTLIVYCFTGFAQARHLAYSFAGPREVLTRDLPKWPSMEFENRDWNPHVKRMLRVAVTNCMLWVLLVTVDSWREGEELTPKGEMLLESLRATLEQEGLYLFWDDIEDILKDFLWYEGMLTWWRSKWSRLIF